MTWLFSKYSNPTKTRWIISWLNILTMFLFHFDKKKKKWNYMSSFHIFTTHWNTGYETLGDLVFFFFFLIKNRLLLLPMWFRDPVNCKQRVIVKICQIIKKIYYFMIQSFKITNLFVETSASIFVIIVTINICVFISPSLYMH